MEDPRLLSIGMVATFYIVAVSTVLLRMALDLYVS